MLRRLLGPLLLLAGNALSQVPLSQNSGVNTSDTHVRFDLTINEQSVITLQYPLYDPGSGTYTSSRTISRNVAYRVEAGYDSSGQLMMNLFSLDSPSDPYLTNSDAVPVARLANGKFVVFDPSGAPIPTVLPNNAPAPNPLQYLGSRGGFSVIEGLRVDDIFSFAQSRGASLEEGSAASCESCSGGSSYRQLVKQAEAGSSRWTYQLVGGAWNLVSIDLSSSSHGIQTNSVASIANVSWFRNATADSQRAAQASTVQNPPAQSTAQPEVSQAQREDPPEANCTTPLGSGSNIVFQHGLISSCNTWRRMHPWMAEKFSFGQVLIPNLSSTSALSSQGTDLLGRMLSSGRNNFVMVGHSQGGLISRDVAQRLYNNGNPFIARGVTSIGTPHQGAFVTLSSRIALITALSQGINSLWARGRCSSPYDNDACFFAALISEGAAGYLVWYGLDAAVPATTDLLPFSNYLSNLNSGNEPFVKVSIESRSTQRWVPMRIAGDTLCNPEDWCGGRTFYLLSQIVYFAFRACSVAALFFGDFDIAIFCSRVAFAMDRIDRLWDLLTSPGDGSDGIVTASSQIYPGATARYVVQDADSHVGSTRSDKIRPVLEAALADQFLLPRNGCTYGISPASASFSATGGGGSLSVTAGSGCSWSVVSGVNWISLTSLSTGNGVGAVNYSVLPNFDPTPRSGLIAVTNGPAIFIEQAGATGCIFYLSPGSASFDHWGGSGVVSVTTQPGCIWSAVSESDFVTVTDGMTGTGAGSFTFQVLDWGESYSRSGTIRINDQRFTIWQDGVPPPPPPNCLDDPWLECEVN